MSISYPVSIKKVAVIGAGYMGGGITQVIASSGITVALADQNPEMSVASRERILHSVEQQEHSNLLPLGTAQRISENVISHHTIESAVADADYITEAVFEKLDVKAATLREISSHTLNSTIISTNTSAIPMEQLAPFVDCPERFIGVHWMNPAPFIPGVEIIPSTVTAPEVIDIVESFIRQLGKTATRVSDSPGFVANRLQFALYREAMLMREEGIATAAQIDEVVSNTFGFRLALFGPFLIGDMAGLDVYAGAYQSLEKEYGLRFSRTESLSRLVENSHVGLKSGQGVYRISSHQAQKLTEYRERAYAALSELKLSLGLPPQVDEVTE